MPEGFPDDKLNAALTKLRAEGIDMSFITSSGSGGGGGGYTFNAKPAGMTDEEAYHKFMEALGFIQPGPWVFTVQIP
jgi:prephenate dehydratase